MKKIMAFSMAAVMALQWQDAGPNRQPIPLLQQRPRQTRLPQSQKTLLRQEPMQPRQQQARSM